MGTLEKEMLGCKHSPYFKLEEIYWCVNKWYITLSEKFLILQKAKLYDILLDFISFSRKSKSF